MLKGSLPRHFNFFVGSISYVFNEHPRLLQGDKMKRHPEIKTANSSFDNSNSLY